MDRLGFIPPPWKELEEDEEFKNLSSSERLKLFDTWTSDMRTFSAKNGFEQDDELKGQLDVFVSEKRPSFLETAKVEETPTLGKVLSDQFASGNRAWGQGVEFISAATGLSSDVDESAKKIAELERANQNVAQTEDMKKFQEAEGFFESAKQIVTNPIDVALPLFTQSIGSQLAPMVAGAAIGAGAGALTGPGAAVAGLIGAGVGSGVGDAVVSFPDFIRAKGYDLTDPEQVKAALNDPEVIAEAGKKSAARGLVVGATSALGGAVAGKATSAAVAATAGKALGTRAATIGGAAVADAALQTGIEGLGEAGAQLVSTGKLDPKEIAAEMFVQTPTQVAEIAIGTAARIKDTAPQTAAALEQKGIQKAQEVVGNAEILETVDITLDEESIQRQAEELDEDTALERAGFITPPDDTTTAPEVDTTADIFANVPKQQPLRDTVISSGIAEDAADDYITNLRNEGFSDNQIRTAAANNRVVMEEAARVNEAEAQAKSDLARRARAGDAEARAQLEVERGITAEPTLGERLVEEEPPVVAEQEVAAEEEPVVEAETEPVEKTEPEPRRITAEEFLAEEPIIETEPEPAEETETEPVEETETEPVEKTEPEPRRITAEEFLAEEPIIETEPEPAEETETEPVEETIATEPEPTEEKPPQPPAPTAEAQAYEDSLVEEAPEKLTNLRIKEDIKDKGWYPDTNINKAVKEIKERVTQRIEQPPPPPVVEEEAPAPVADTARPSVTESAPPVAQEEEAVVEEVTEPVEETTPPPAPRTLDQLTDDKLDQESTILERQAENETDPVRAEEINTQIQAVTAERRRRTAPLTADSPVAPAPSAPEVTATQAPVATNEQAQAPVTDPSAAPTQSEQPAPQGLPPELSAPTPDAQAYEDALVEEARNAGTKIAGTTNKGIKDAIQGKGWYPKTNINKAIKEIKERVQRRLEATPAPAQDTASAPATALPEGATELIAESRTDNAVPSSATINQRFADAPVEQRQAVRREAAKQVANDLGIEYSEELDFAKDFDGNDNLPIRVTQTGTEPVFVNNAEVTARQIDAGFTPVVPEAMRGRVVQGITFDADTGQVTSAVGRGVTTTQPGDLARGVRAQRPGTQSQATLATDKIRKNARLFFRKLNKQDQRDFEGIRVALQNRTPSSREIAAAFSPDDLVEAGLIKWARERVKDRTLAKDKRKNYSASQIWNFVMKDAAEKLKTMPRSVSLDAPLTETGTITRGDTLVDEKAEKDRADREATIDELDAIDEGVTVDEPIDLKDPVGGASTGINYDQAFSIINSPQMLRGRPKAAAAKLRAEAQELLDMAPQSLIDELENNDIDYWTWTAEDFRNVDTGNTNQVVSSSKRDRSPYIAEQRSWMQQVARSLGMRNVSDFTPPQFTQLARFFADRFRGSFDQGVTALPENALAETLPEIRAMFEAPQGAAATYRDAVEGLRTQFPGAKIRYSTGHNASAWYDPRFRDTLFLNPLILEQELGGLTSAEAHPFLRAVLDEEYTHLVRKQTIPDKIVIAIAQNLSDTERQRTIESYVAAADQYTDPAQRQEIIDAMDDLSIGDEYIRMLRQKLLNGQTTEDLSPEKLPQTLFEQIKKYFEALVSRLKARLTVARDPLLAHTINALESGMRLLELDQKFQQNPASITREELVFARRRANPVSVDIDDIDNALPPGNGWLRPDGSWVAAETTSAGDAVQGWEAEMGQFGGHEAAALEFLSINDPNAYALLQDALNKPDAFERGYEVVTDYMKNMGWLRVVQQDGDRIVFNGVANKAQERALFTSAILDEKMLVSDNGRRTQTIYEPPTGGIQAARPGVRIRGKRVGGAVPRKPGGFFSSGAFTPTERSIILKASQKIAKAAANAEFLVNEFRRAVKKAYGKNPAPLDLINQALGSTDNRLTDQQVTDLKKIRDKDARELQRLQFMRDNRNAARVARRDALNQLPAPVAKAVEEMGAKIDELSVTMMNEGYIADDLIPVFEENLELYLHRSYAIFESPEWKDNMIRAGEIAETIRGIADPVERQKAIAELPKTTREHVRVRVAFERFATERAIAEYATEIRRQQKQNGVNITRQDAIKLAKADTATVERKASDLVLRYLTVADQDAYRFFVQGRRIPGRRDMDIIKVRGQVPKELREFWGEIKNAETNFTQTVSKLAAFMAHHDVASELLNNGVTEGYIWKAGVSKDPNPNPEFVPLIPKGTASPDSVSPLYGAYGPVELRDALVQMTQPQNTAGWARAFSFMTAMAMAMKTIGYMPRSFIRNFFGNPLIVLGRGLFNLSDPLSMARALGDGFRVARLNSGLGGNASYQALRERLLELGVIGDNVRGTLLKKLYEESTEGEKIAELLKRTEYDTALEKMGVKTAQGVYKGASKLADIYQGVDDIWKVYAWEMEKVRQKKAHPTWDVRQIEEAAAENVRNLVPTYSLSPDVTQRIRRIPLFAPFITWTSEILRTTGNNIALAKQEIEEGYRTGNTAMRANGAARLSGFLLATAALPAFAMAMKGVMGYDDEDEEAIRTSLRDWQKNAQLIFISTKDQGKVRFLDLSYLDPNQVFVEPLIAASRAFKKGDNPFSSWATELLRPLFSEQLFVGAMADVMRNRTADGRPIVNDQDTPVNKTIGYMTHVTQAIGPGTLVTSVPNIIRGTKGEVSPSGKVFSLSDEVYSQIFGSRISDIDAQTTLGQAAGRYMGSNAEATQLLNDTLLSRGTINNNDIGSAYENANRAKRQIFETLRDNYNAALKLGVPKAAAISILRERKISNELIGQIVNDRYVDYTPTKQTFNEVLRRPDGRARLNALRDYLLQKREQDRNQDEGQDE